ncbi:thermonuclease family protein [Sphingobacterium kitahiroshimense]|uniref:Thermonuclease family protein n=1 Tax=Sphingobacterium kitahiroshimense TaxID=470446 RepID=A0ABV0BZW5_9SPHI
MSFTPKRESAFAILFFLLLPIYLFSQTIKGKVIRVADGDTITILDSANNQLRVRLYGIDAPEKGQDFGNVAKNFISDLCFSKTVSIDIKDIDRYGRTVGIVWTVDSINLNLELLRSGLAWHYKHFDNSDDLAQAEHLAKINKVGLWKHPNALPPCEFRS